MKYLLDTNICVEMIRRRNPIVMNRMLHLENEDIGVSVITLAELEYGAQRSQNPTKNRDALDKMCSIFRVLPLNGDVAISFGQIRCFLEKTGTPIGPLDTLIAAHALSQNLIMVTNNAKEFSRVPTLVIENWCES